MGITHIPGTDVMTRFILGMLLHRSSTSMENIHACLRQRYTSKGKVSHRCAASADYGNHFPVWYVIILSMIQSNNLLLRTLRIFCTESANCTITRPMERPKCASIQMVRLLQNRRRWMFPALSFSCLIGLNAWISSIQNHSLTWSCPYMLHLLCSSTLVATLMT